MFFRPVLSAAVFSIVGGMVFAESAITVNEGYVVSAPAAARAAAAFMVVSNEGDMDDRLIGARSEVADLVALHTSDEDEDGVMSMSGIEEGIAIPAGASHVLEHGGDHVMFMGLAVPLAEEEDVPLTLIFERAGEMDLDLPVRSFAGAGMDREGHGDRMDGHMDHAGGPADTDQGEE